MKLNRYFTLILIISFSLLTGATTGLAAKKAVPKQVLIKNVNIFDGDSDKLKMGMNVLVEGNLIKKIGKNLKAGSVGIVIDGKGRTLTPGLIDMHQHLMLNGGTAAGTYEFSPAVAKVEATVSDG